MSERAPSPSAGPAEPPPGAVLVIDDELAVRNVTQALLERGGYRVLTAATGAEGLEVVRLHAGTIRLVVLDLTMPQMNGRDVLRELERVDAGVRVILASGYVPSDQVPDAPNVVGYLHKPFRFADLLAAVRRAGP